MGAYMSSDPPKTKWSILKGEVCKLGEDYEVEFDDGEHGLANFDRCKKNKDHKNMIPVKNFSMLDLPNPWRMPNVLVVIMYLAQSVVKINVPYISSSRPDKYPGSAFRGYWVPTTGTGFAVFPENGPSQPCIDCPIQDCPFERPHKVTPEFHIITATHVVFDKSEAKKSTIEFFYDSDDRSSVVEAQVVRFDGSVVKGDQCILICVSHNLSLFQKLKPQSHFLPPNLLPSSWIPYRGSKDPPVFVVSHPHGSFKHVSVGEWVDFKKDSLFSNPGSMNIKIMYFLKHMELQSRVWREEGLTLGDGYYLSPERMRDLERQVQQNPELTWTEWMRTQSGDPMALLSISYTAATCPGSSGSQVWVFIEDENGDVRHCVRTTHFGHRKGKRNISGVVQITSKTSGPVKEHLRKLQERHNQSK